MSVFWRASRTYSALAYWRHVALCGLVLARDGKESRSIGVWQNHCLYRSQVVRNVTYLYEACSRRERPAKTSPSPWTRKEDTSFEAFKSNTRLKDINISIRVHAKLKLLYSIATLKPDSKPDYSWSSSTYSPTDQVGFRFRFQSVGFRVWATLIADFWQSLTFLNSDHKKTLPS